MGADPTVVQTEELIAKAAEAERALDADAKMVVPMSVTDCWRWMLIWLWHDKRADMYWCIAAVVWNCIWTLYSPVILSDIINEATFSASRVHASCVARVKVLR